MKNLFGILIFGVGLITFGCKEEKIEKQQAEDEIIYQSVNITLDSLGEEIVQITFDDRLRFRFFIINLLDYNDNWEAENTDTLAAGVETYETEVIDDSKFGYFNALDKDAVIGANSGFWNQRLESNGFVFSTSWGAGEFKGAGDKYFGFRLQQGSGFIYGWFLVNCTEKSDKLEIKAYAYNKTAENSIKAGQEE